MVVSALSLNFETPQNDTLDLKNRKSLDPDLTPEGNAHRSTKASSAAKSTKKQAQQYFKYLKETDDTLEILANKVYMHGETLTQHYQEILQNAGYYEAISSRVDNAEGILAEETRKMNDIEYSVRTIEGTGVIQDSQFISQLSGQFEIWTNPVTGKKTLHLVDGAEMAIDDTNGGQITVGSRIAQVAHDVADGKAVTDSIQGSALWTQRDNITGIVGEFDVQYEEIEDPNHPGQYIVKKTLIVKSGGGMKIRRDGVEYGVYDKGELTGGLMVEKINGQAVAKIRGDRVNIEAADVKISATDTLQTVTGHFVERKIKDVDDQGNITWRSYLEYVADAGMVVKRPNENDIVTEYGIWDEGNLTGGVMVQKINGQTETFIKGTKVHVGDDLSDLNLPDWAQDRDGLIAGRATIGDLAAVSARVGDLEADYITSQNIKSTIGNITQLEVKGLLVKNQGAILFETGSLGITIPSDIMTFSSGQHGVSPLHPADFLTAVQVVGPTNNVYTLQYKKGFNTSWQNAQTFSRATTLTGTWSSGVYTVNASPQGNQIATTIGKKGESWSGNTCTVTIGYEDPINGNMVTTGKTITVDGSGRWADGYDTCAGTIGTDTNPSGTLSYGTTYTINVQYTNRSSGNKTTAKTITFTTPSDRYSTGYAAGYDACSDNISTDTTPSGTLAYGTTYTIKVQYTSRSTGSKVTKKTITFTTPSDRYSTGYAAGYDACSDNISTDTNPSGTLSYGTTYTIKVQYTSRSTGSKVTKKTITFTTPSDRFNYGYGLGYSDGFTAGWFAYYDTWDTHYQVSNGKYTYPARSPADPDNPTIVWSGVVGSGSGGGSAPDYGTQYSASCTARNTFGGGIYQYTFSVYAESSTFTTGKHYRLFTKALD